MSRHRKPTTSFQSLFHGKGTICDSMRRRPIAVTQLNAPIGTWTWASPVETSELLYLVVEIVGATISITIAPNPSISKRGAMERVITKKSKPRRTSRRIRKKTPSVVGIDPLFPKKSSQFKQKLIKI